MIDTSDTKKKMIEALEASLGIVSHAADIVGIHRATHYTWMNSDPEYRAAVESIDDLALDLSESALHKNIRNGDTASIIFHLKTKGKKRGYVERSQVELKATGNFEEMDDADLQARLAELEGK